MDAQDLADHLEDVAISSTKQARGGGSARGGRGGAKKSGEGGRGKREVDLSRALSRLLRHQAGNAGVELDREGFADLGRVLEWGPLRALAPAFDEILNAVHNSDKQRFAIKPNPATNPSLDESSTTPSHWLIRANQGHSIELASEHLLKPLAVPVPSDKGPQQPDGTLPIPPTVVHGTYFAFWPAILASGGLKPMGRNHVHCSTGLPEDAEAGVISGMRRDAELLIYVDVEASMREGGIKWWMSDNGVVLTEGGADGLVPVEYFRLVEGRRQVVGVLWKDGEKVADLPEGLKVRAPQGKRGGRGGGGGGGGGVGGGGSERGGIF
ncbi:tRNA 2'-phosphotransferase 1 [Staphylotrichum tortipilum]|uniref:2'-phosphotransferase n=1 Tax=Staphylotrichum tortipilum TaxID=2831512 RepID=A0AAN6MJ35_9PEZI|nr:tRNA 2'-phosphotransferase 1 [Staphylotrichum longicolle]